MQRQQRRHVDRPGRPSVRTPNTKPGSAKGSDVASCNIIRSKFKCLTGLSCLLMLITSPVFELWTTTRKDSGCLGDPVCVARCSKLLRPGTKWRRVRPRRTPLRAPPQTPRHGSDDKSSNEFFRFSKDPQSFGSLGKAASPLASNSFFDGRFGPIGAGKEFKKLQLAACSV